jgi:hypothetical protein
MRPQPRPEHQTASVRDAFADRYVPDSPPTKKDEAGRKAFARAMREAQQTNKVAELNNGGGHWLMRTDQRVGPDKSQ